MHVDIRITGEEFEIKEFLQLLAKIQYLGTVGSSKTIPVHVDGDGSGHLRFEVVSESDPPSDIMKRYNQLIIDDKIIGIDSESFKSQLNNNKLETHFIGE